MTPPFRHKASEVEELQRALSAPGRAKARWDGFGG